MRDRRILASHRLLWNVLRALKRRRLAVKGLAHATESLFYAIFLCLLLALSVQVQILPSFSLTLYLGILIGALSFGFAVAIFKTRKDLWILADADRCARLRERLSTAYEILLRGNRGGFSRLVLEDAESRCSLVRPREVYPLRLPAKTKAIPLMMAVLLVTVLVDFGLPPLPLLRDEIDSQIKQEGRDIEELGRRLAARAEQQALPETLKLGNDIQRLGKRMQHEPMSLEQSREELTDLADRVIRRMGEIRRIPVDEPEQQTQKLPLVSDDLLGEPSNASEPGGTMYESSAEGGRSAASGEPGSEGNGEGRGSAESGRQRPQGSEERSQRLMEETQNLTEAAEALRKAAENLEGSPEEGLAPEIAGSKTEESGLQEGDSGEREPEAKEGSSGTPGSRPVEDIPSGERPASVPSSLEDIMVEPVGQGEESFGVLLRSLPLGSLKEGTQEEVLQNYRKRVEEAVRQESIPLNLRKYIRDYFIRIGVSSTEK
jgi:hypothetical protein